MDCWLRQFQVSNTTEGRAAVSTSTHRQVGEELGEVGFDDFVGEGDSEGAFFGGGADEAFVEGLADDLAGGGAFEAEDGGDGATTMKHPKRCRRLLCHRIPWGWWFGGG